MGPLPMILITLATAHVLSEILKRIGLPRAVGYMAAGLLLGTTAIKEKIFTDQNTDILSFLSNFGIILLFYYIGLKTDFKAFERRFMTSASKSSLVIAIVARSTGCSNPSVRRMPRCSAIGTNSPTIM